MTSNLRDYAIAFLLTLVLEVVVALLLGYRKRVEIACVVLVNVFSWPLLNYLIWVVGSLRSDPVSTPEILLFEAGVVVVEWGLLCYALPRHSKRRLLLLSLAMNGASYAAGFFIPWA
jgi:hypothetical protein